MIKRTNPTIGLKPKDSNAKVKGFDTTPGTNSKTVNHPRTIKASQKAQKAKR